MQNLYANAYATFINESHTEQVLEPACEWVDAQYGTYHRAQPHQALNDQVRESRVVVVDAPVFVLCRVGVAVPYDVYGTSVCRICM